MTSERLTELQLQAIEYELGEWGEVSDGVVRALVAEVRALRRDALRKRVAELEQRVAALEAAARDDDPLDLDPSDPEKSLAHTFAFVADLMKKVEDSID